MKPGSSNGKQRSRGRNGGGKKHMPPRNQTFDSSGPDVRVRGNAHQVMEKYLAMARDASSQGDRISAENYYQHAEHYFRMINAQNSANGRQRPQNAPTPAEDQMAAEDEEAEAAEAAEAAPKAGGDHAEAFNA